MTDKIQKIREWAKARLDENASRQSLPQFYGMMEEDARFLDFLDSLQEEPKPKFKKGNKVIYLNEEYVVEDITDHYILRSTRERTSVPVVHVGFGNEDYELRLVEEPVSAELIEELKKIVNIRECVSQGVPVIKIARHFAQWQKEQMMKDSVLCGVDGWFINNDRNCRKNGRFYKYYVSTISHDKPLPMENGKDYRLITIKED